MTVSKESLVDMLRTVFSSLYYHSYACSISKYKIAPPEEIMKRTRN